MDQVIEILTHPLKSLSPLFAGSGTLLLVIAKKDALKRTLYYGLKKLHECIRLYSNSIFQIKRTVAECIEANEKINPKITESIRNIANEEINRREADLLIQQKIKTIEHNLKLDQLSHESDRDVDAYHDKTLIDVYARKLEQGTITVTEFSQTYENFRSNKRTQAEQLIKARVGVEPNPNFEYESLIETAQKLVKCGDKVKNLLQKVVTFLNKNPASVSLSTIKLIEQFTDQDIEKLEEIFSYIGRTRSILFYEEISQDFQKSGLCQNRSDNIKYLGKIFSDQKNISGKGFSIKLTPINIEGIWVWKELIKFIPIFVNGLPFNEESLATFCKNEANRDKITALLNNFEAPILSGSTQILVSKQPDNNVSVTAEIATFVILTEEGQQIYDLMQDQTNPAPKEFLNKLKTYLEKQYPQLGLKVRNN